MTTVKIVQKSVKDQALGDAFQGLLGLNGPNLEIVLPKLSKIKVRFEKIKKCIMRLVSKSFCEENARHDAEEWYKQNELSFGTLLDNIYQKFTEQCKVDGYTDEEKHDIIAPLICGDITKQYNQDELKEMNEEYSKFKQSPAISTIMVMCRNLIHHKQYLAEKDKLNPRFIEDMVSHEFAPLIITRFNFKSLFTNLNTHETVKKYLLDVLHMLYNTSYEIYKLVTSPDIDVEKFAQLVIDNIGNLKKHIPRCNEAFDKIEESVSLLRSNFGSYYKDFVITKNPTTIIENFVMDVADNTKGNLKLARQFKIIVTHYKKLSQTRGNVAPEVNMLFEKLEENFKTMDNMMVEKGMATREEIEKDISDISDGKDDTKTDKEVNELARKLEQDL